MSKSVNMTDVSLCDCETLVQNSKALTLWFSGTDTKTQCLLCLSYNAERCSAIKLVCTVAMLMLHICKGFFHSSSNSSQLPKWGNDFLTHIANLLPAKVFMKNWLRDLTKTATQITKFTFCSCTPCGFSTSYQNLFTTTHPY